MGVFVFADTVAEDLPFLEWQPFYVIRGGVGPEVEGDERED